MPHITPILSDGAAAFEYDKLDNSVDALRKSIANRLVYAVGKDLRSATRRDWLFALFHAVRDRTMHRWRETLTAANDQDAKRVYYLSMEFLTGRALTNALMSVGIYDDAKTACTQLGADFDALIDLEHGFVAVDSSSRKNSEEFVSQIRGALGSFPALAGASLTVTLLDQELTALWDAPVHTAALRW